MKPKVLIINSYAGSLTIAASSLGCEVVGSYEDAGYGIEAQKLNFPDLKYIDRHPWPKQDLRGVTVIAHPPCAPFSIMNPQKGTDRVGTAADGFQCHRDVLEYALGNSCKALAIESVPGVLKAASEYENAAKEHDYHHFFVKVNSIGFGVPQWRPRIWILFTKHDRLNLNYIPRFVPLSTIIQEKGTAIERGGETHIIVRRLKEAGLKGEMLRRIFEGEYGCGNILQIGQAVLEIDEVGENFAKVREKWNLGGLFAAMMPRVLDPTKWAPTILGGSAWFIHGRPLFLEEFNAIMGFPVDYKWPGSFSDPRTYLSKGVCPPVAVWILQHLLFPPKEFNYYVNAGDLLNLDHRKAEVEDALGGRTREPGERKSRKYTSQGIERVARSASEQLDAFQRSLGEDECD